MAGYFDVDPDDCGINCRREIIETLEAMGFEIEASHHEVAEGQHEVNFKYADALTAADNTVTFKWVVRSIAAEYGMHTNPLVNSYKRLLGYEVPLGLRPTARQ